MSGWSTDKWGDFITIGSLFLALAVASYYAIRRTWHWDRLGVALTLFFGGLTLLFGLAVYGIAFGGPAWLVHLRWTIRAVLTAVAVATIAIMASDEPPDRGARRQ